jgi:hypothetical protein
LKRFSIFLVLLVLFLTTAFATCSIDVDDFTLGVRNDSGNYYSSISAEDNDDIDIRIEFSVNDIIDEDDCASNLTAKATIFHWDEDNDEWDSWRTTTSKSQTLDEDTFVFTWSNELTIDDRYDRYRIVGTLKEGTTELEAQEAYIDVEDNSCSGIELVTNDFEINEDTSQTRTFRIENNTNTDFDVSDADVTFSTSIITSGSVDYPSTVQDNSLGNATVELDAGFVSYDRTATGRFRVSGYLGNTFCSIASIGEETFTVNVEDTGTSGNGSNTGTSSDCDDISLHVRDFVMEEDSSTQEIFYLNNDSTKRFELTDVDVTENGLELEAFYYEKYAFSGNLADIIIKASTGSVFSDKTYDNTIKVKGRFSNGKTCSFSDIENDFETQVLDATTNAPTNCDGFNISVTNSVSISNYASIPVTITNNTNARADVYIEGLQASPSIITLPANSAISRDVSITLFEDTGELVLRPNVSGCNASVARVSVTNTTTGNLSSVAMNIAIANDANNNVISINFINPTNKLFVGVLSVEIENGIVTDRVLTIPAGNSFAEVIIPSTARNGKVIFESGNDRIETEFSESEDFFAGFFTFGGGVAAIGLGLLVLIVVIVAIVVVVTDYSRRTQEIWEIEKQ